MAVDRDPRVEKAMEVIERYGGIDGGHHKMWVIDQVARALMEDTYGQWVIDMKAGEDGPETYDWDVRNPAVNGAAPTKV